MVTPESRIAWSDKNFMHVERRRCSRDLKRSVPEWVFNNEMLRHVCLIYLERRFAIHAPTGASHTERLAAINKVAAAQKEQRMRVVDVRLDQFNLAKDRHTSSDRMKRLALVLQVEDTRAVVNSRIAAVILGVAYMSWRQRMKSTEVAEALGIKPPHVRIILYRLKRIHADIQAGNPRGRAAGHPGWRKTDTAKLKRLRESGKPWKEIAAIFGRSKQGCMSHYYNNFLRVPPLTGKP